MRSKKKLSKPRSKRKVYQIHYKTYSWSSTHTTVLIVAKNALEAVQFVQERLCAESGVITYVNENAEVYA